MRISISLLVQVLGIHLEPTSLTELKKIGKTFVEGIPSTGDNKKYARMKHLWLGEDFTNDEEVDDTDLDATVDVDAEEVSLAAVNVGIEQSSRSTSTSTSTSTSSSSFLDDVPNKIASNIFWPLRNVSYKDGVIYFHQASEEDKKKMTEEYFGTRGHLPWGDPNKESSIPSRIRNIEFTDTEFDESVCKSVEPKVRSEFGLVPLLCARVRTLTNGGHTSQ